ncbi:hypothetical protein V6N11_044553 [Hibiscus sabdariffa]|uniref:Uncharacterized protein n=1 Tax=Hibiscus sabdariffa TaxID=183260 RepID=A0ABR2N973_9ROSI
MGLEEGTSSGEGTWFGEGIKCFNNEPVDNEFRFLHFQMTLQWLLLKRNLVTHASLGQVYKLQQTLERECRSCGCQSAEAFCS